MPAIRRKILILSTVVPLLLLSACEGYEMRLYDGFPYGDQRTAGHGVQYVLAKMMPKKGPVLEPAPAPAPPPPPPPEPVAAPAPVPITPADPIIEQKARK